MSTREDWPVAKYIPTEALLEARGELARLTMTALTTEIVAALRERRRSHMSSHSAIQARLEYLRGQIEAECISYGEIHELQGLAEHIEPGDTQLLEWAGVPEFPDDED